jgi:hypothetical protein
MITQIKTQFYSFFNNETSAAINQEEATPMFFVFLIGLEKPEKSIAVKAPDKATAEESVRRRYPEFNMIWLSKHSIEYIPDWKNMMPGKIQTRKKELIQDKGRILSAFSEWLSTLFYPRRHAETANPDFMVVQHNFINKAV